MRIFIYILLSLIYVSGYTQSESEDHKIGIKVSVNGSTLLGSELINRATKFGYTAGMYYQYTINDNWKFHSEFIGNFQGSKFNNRPNEYSKIALFYMDVPLLFSYAFDDDKKHSVLIGPYVSYLALSSMYVGDQRKAVLNVLDLKPWDYGAAVYYHLNGKLVTFQIGVKAGLYNINDGINFVDIKPVTGNNGTINNFSVEIGFLF